MALDTIEVARAEIAKIYIAAFNRVPDAGGLSNWMNQYMAGVMTYEQIAEDFTNQTEYTTKYPSIMTNTEYVTAIYENVFGREPDAGGLVNWVNQLDATSITGINRGNIMTYMLASAASNTDGERLDNQASFAIQSILSGVPEATATAQLANITSDATTVTTATAAVAGEAGAVLGSTLTLHAAIETITGTANNDTITGVLSTTAANNTINSLDAINAAAGTDTFNVLDETGGQKLPSGLQMTGVETINVRSAGDIGATGAGTFDVSSYTDVTTLNATQGADVFVAAATTTNINVSGVSGNIAIDGGKAISVTDATADKSITIGATTVNAGTVTVNDTKQGTGTIDVDGGTNVTVNATSTKTSGAITIGTNEAASGAVVVTQNTTSDNSAAITQGNITVTGGSTVTVNVNSTNTASATSTGVNNLTAGTVTVTGDSKTTAVTINQNNVANDYASVTTGAAKETAVVTFSSLKAGEKAIISVGALTGAGTDLTFTASKDLTAAQVAAAFANLTNADIQASGGIVANGVFTGTLDSGYTSGAVSGSTVTFTSTTNTNATNIVVSAKLANGTTDTTNVASFTVVTTDGTTGTSTTARDLTAANDNVVINDNATAAITDVTVNGYGTANIGTTRALTKLANLSLANSGGTATIDAAAGITSLNLTVNNVKNTVDISTNSTTVATLNVTTKGAASSFAITAAQVKDLTVSGDQKLTLTGTTTALETVKVTGTASLDISGVSANAAKSIDTTGTTGTVTAKIDASAATYAGGTGVDNVTLTGTALTKAVDLGAGDDTLVFDAAVTGSTATLSGGTGTDTLSMTVANANVLNATTQTFYTNFEHLTLNNAYGDNDNTLDTLTLNLANLGFTNYVTTSGTVADTTTPGNSDILVLDKLAANATVVLTAKGLITAQLADATGTADVLNVIDNVAASNIDFGTLTAASVETINITANDTLVDDNSDGTVTTAEAAPETATLKLVATSATTVNIAGSANVSLNMTDNTKATLIDGSTMTGALSVTSYNTTDAVTIKGGSAADTLIASSISTQADILMGGAGNDSLTAGAGMDKLYGGDGADTFNISVASVNVNSASTIMDLASGDVIKFANADSFKAAAISLDNTAVFQDYANAAIAAITADNGLAWFQYSGNTYVIQEVDNSTNANVFVNAEDLIVKISGLVDLSTASFNAISGTLEIA